MIINYNTAIPANFKITFPRIPELEFYALSTNVPTTSLSPIEQNWQDVRIKVPDNKYVWDDVTIQFIMDENLYVYEILKNWQAAVRDREYWQHGLHDMFIIPLDSNKIIEYKFSYQGAWPNMVSGWQYTSGASISDAITFDVTFSYQHFGIEREKPLDFKI